MTKKRWLLVGMSAIAALLIAIRLYLPHFAKDYINKTIDQSEDFSGRIEDVDLSVLRGQMTARGLEIYKKSLPRAKPLLQAEFVTINVYLLPLFKRQVIGSVFVEKPKLSMVASSDRKIEKEAKDAKAIAKKADEEDLFSLVPVRIDHFKVRNGSLVFTKSDTKPPINVVADQVIVDAVNLTNSKKVSKSYIAKINIRAHVMNSGDFRLKLALNPLDKKTNFDLAARLLHMKASELNPVTKEYGKFDFEKGRIDMVTQVSVRNNYMNGYVKPLFRDIEVSGPKDKSRDKDSFPRRVWESIVGAGEDVVENKKIVQSGSIIPLKGKINAPSTRTADAVKEVLRNAFVKALLPNYEKTPIDT